MADRVMLVCCECGWKGRRLWPALAPCECGEPLEPLSNPQYRLTEVERLHVSILAHIADKKKHSERWTRTAVANAYGISRKTVINCVERYPIA